MAKTAFANGQLRSFIERVERLESEKAATAADIKEIYAEAKGSGFDVKIMRQVVSLRKMDTADRQEMEAMRDLYLSALGMLGDTPLGAAAASMAEGTKKQRSSGEPADAPDIMKKFGEAIVADHAAGKSAMGASIPITPEEKEKGVVAAFQSKDGTRCSIAVPPR